MNVMMVRVIEENRIGLSKRTCKNEFNIKHIHSMVLEN